MVKEMYNRDGCEILSGTADRPGNYSLKFGIEINYYFGKFCLK